MFWAHLLEIKNLRPNLYPPCIELFLNVCMYCLSQNTDLLGWQITLLLQPKVDQQHTISQRIRAYWRVAADGRDPEGGYTVALVPEVRRIKNHLLLTRSAKRTRK